MEAAQEASNELKKTHKWLDEERTENARLAYKSAAQVCRLSEVSIRYAIFYYIQILIAYTAAQVCSL